MMNQEDPLNLTTLIKLTDGNLAEILKLALADEEIECAIEGEHQAGLTGVFQIRVLVPQKDLAHAEQILQEHVARMEGDDEQGKSDDLEDS